MSNLNDPVKLFSELLGGPLGSLISSVGKGVGEAQAALDHGALAQTLDLYDYSKDGDRSPEALTLINLARSLGYQPTFYAIPETEVEAQISLSMDIKPEQSSPVAGMVLSKYAINATPLNAGNVNRFGLQSNAMAKMKFKIVPVPPSAGVSELRVIPDLTPRVWNESTRLFIETLGFTYELRDVNGHVITSHDLDLDGHSIVSHIPAGATIASTNTPLVITIDVQFVEVPELIGMAWSAGAKQLIEEPGFSFELKDVDGQSVTDDDADGYPITGQSPAAGSFASTNNPIVVTVDVNAF